MIGWKENICYQSRQLSQTLFVFLVSNVRSSIEAPIMEETNTLNLTAPSKLNELLINNQNGCQIPLKKRVSFSQALHSTPGLSQDSQQRSAHSRI
jgi:hypothetical protein